MDEHRLSRTSGGDRNKQQRRAIPLGLIVLFLVACGSLVFFFKSSSFLSTEFHSHASQEVLHQGDVLDAADGSLSGGGGTSQRKSSVAVVKPSPSTSKDATVEKLGEQADASKAPPKQQQTQSGDDSKKKTSEEKQTTTNRTAEKPDESQQEKPVAGSETNESSEGQKDESQEEDRKGKKPLNVLLLYPDDWRHDDIGGVAPVVRTPFLNRLASEGIRFTHNCVTTSTCWMSRATLFTGQYVSRHRSVTLRLPRFTYPWAWNHTWPYLLQQKKGYHVGHIGKWQFRDTPKNRDSLFNYSFFLEGRHWHMFRRKWSSAADIARDATVDFLRKRPKDKPFALTVAFYPPKAVGNSLEPGSQWKPDSQVRATYDNITIPEPYEDINMKMTEAYNLIHPKIQSRISQARLRWVKRWNSSEHYQAGMKNYYALIEQVDKACEQIVDELKAQGLYENTVVIFTTDNGLFHGSHGLGGKWYAYDESIRVPLIVYDPRMPQAKRGTLDDSFTLNIDLAETILGAAGLDADPVMQGRDIADLYLPNKDLTPEHQEPWRAEFFYEFPEGSGGGRGKTTALVRKDYKYMYWQEDMKIEQLYDLKKDPHEFYDVKDLPEHEVLLKEMRQRHDELKAKSV